MKNVSKISFGFIFFWSFQSLGSPLDFPGMINIGTDSQQAVDLIENDGRSILPEALTGRLKQGQDISLLNPAPSDLWSDQMLPRLNLQSYTLGLAPGSEVQMESNTPSVVGEYRFVVSMNRGGSTQQYQVLIGKKAHNILLRKALLEKIGYQIEPVQWMSQLRVHFNGHASLLGFLTDIQNNTEGNPERWVTSNVKDDSINYVDLQDVLIFPANIQIYSIESGAIPPSIIQGRRVMNSLLVPFSLTDVPESVNSFSWVAGRVINQSVYLSYEWAQWFNPSFQDARWIMRRIAALSVQDWQEIANAAQVPREVAFLIAEKLKGRRNSLVDLFQFSGEKLPVNGSLSFSPNLVAGKIIPQNWPGYASRFSYGDPDSPLSTAEVTGFLKSKGISSIINSAMGTINSYFNNNNHVQNQVSDHVLKNLVDQLVSQVVNKQAQSIPLGMYAFPSISGSLLLSREVVIGSYMGTDNRVQLADTFGFQITPGAFIGIDGLGANISESGSVGLQIQRSYTHIKPVKSILAANKTPYKNMIVPLLKRKWAGDLSFKNDSSGHLDLEAIATALDQDMGIGESLIITDSVTAQAGFTFDYPVNPSVDFQTKFNASQMIIHRMQIYKADKHSYQIYNDPGKVLQGSAAFGLNLLGVPILTISVGALKGTVNTGLYSLALVQNDGTLSSEAQAANELKVRALRQIFFENSLELLRTQQKPYLIGHEFSEKDLGIGLFFYHYRSEKIKDRFQFQAPTGEQKAVLFRSTGGQRGKDYTTLISQMLTRVLQSKMGISNVSIDASSNGNPGDSFYGSSVTRQILYEGAQSSVSDKNAPLLESPDAEFAQITHLHKGWSISKEDALNIISDMKKQFGYDLVDPKTLNDTNKLLLYSVSLNINIYRNGILKLAQVPKEQVSKLLSESLPYSKCVGFNRFDSDCVEVYDEYQSHLNSFINAQKDYLTARTVNGPRAADMALDFVNMAEAYFPGKILVDILGAENVLVTSKIEGFRENDELGDSPILGSTIGLAGSRAVTGPLALIQQNLRALNGEFFLSWLLNPL